jgi:hypothetical protein
MFIHKVCTALERAEVPYAVVGGYAVALHGAVRGTVDVDFVINWTLENLQKVEHVMQELGLVSRIPINALLLFQNKDEYSKNKNLIAWNFYDPKNPAQQIDLIVNYDLQHSDIMPVHTQAGTIQVLAKKPLIAMKHASGRAQDIEDVKALEGL